MKHACSKHDPSPVESCKWCQACNHNPFAARPSEESSRPAPGSANLAAFGSEILEAAKERVADCGGGEYDDDIMEVAHRHGLVQRVVYDPDKHGKVNEDCEPGNEIWWWGSGEDSQNVGTEGRSEAQPS